MANIWRKQPSGRLRHGNLLRRAPTDASQLIATGFFVGLSQVLTSSMSALLPHFSSLRLRLVWLLV